MALKSTKAMPVQSTESKLKKWDQQYITEKPLRESQNIAKGYFSEKVVINFLIKNDFQICHQRWKTPFAEVDIMAKKNNKFYLFEVKTLKDSEFKPNRLSKTQKKRLERSHQWAIQFYYPLELWLVFVVFNGKLFVDKPKLEWLRWDQI